MLAQRTLLRTAQRLPSRTAPLRSTKRSYSTETGSGFKPQDNAFNRERDAVKAHAAQSSDFWRKLSLYVAIPALAIGTANAYTLWNEHWEHEAHRPPPEERPQYSYLNIRNKPFPWGNGNKTLFWNDKQNYVKDE